MPISQAEAHLSLKEALFELELGEKIWTIFLCAMLGCLTYRHRKNLHRLLKNNPKKSIEQTVNVLGYETTCNFFTVKRGVF